ncbi:MAG: ethanolamine ammonia-lyase subunit EutC [Pseudomonadota bacterium]
MTASDPWERLRRFTTARIALGRTGGSLPTRAQLEFQLAHARARDAVHHAVDFERLAEQLTLCTGLDTRTLTSAASDRQQFLLRPDLGRRLTAASGEIVDAVEQSAASPASIALVIGDGLSGFAVERHAPALIEGLLPRLTDLGLSLSPLLLVRNARVAIQDDIGSRLGARLALMFIGERPGLGVPDSLAVYFTWAPRPGRSDAERNCVSNIRTDGLAPHRAADRVAYLVEAAFRRQLSGVQLKDDSLLQGSVTSDRSKSTPPDLPNS